MDEYDWPPWGSGSAHAISDSEQEQDVIELLHAVIEEVTGKPVEKPAPRKIGFY